MSTFGIMYVATGNRFVTEASQSVKSLKKVMPDIEVSLYTDCLNHQLDLFDHIIPISDPHYSVYDKISSIINMPYHKTLYLDTDTYIAHPIWDVFTLLNRFDIAVTHAPGRVRTTVVECPECFPEMNSGFIALNKNKNVIETMKKWLIEYNKQINESFNNTSDQGVLRKVLYLSDNSIYILPPEYNFRSLFPGFAGHNMNVKIIHGRSQSKRIARSINSTKNKRIYLPTLFVPQRSNLIVGTNIGFKCSVFYNYVSHLFHKLKMKISRKLIKINSLLSKNR